MSHIINKYKRWVLSHSQLPQLFIDRLFDKTSQMPETGSFLFASLDSEPIITPSNYAFYQYSFSNHENAIFRIIQEKNKEIAKFSFFYDNDFFALTFEYNLSSKQITLISNDFVNKKVFDYTTGNVECISYDKKAHFFYHGDINLIDKNNIMIKQLAMDNKIKVQHEKERFLNNIRAQYNNYR